MTNIEAARLRGSLTANASQSPDSPKAIFPSMNGSWRFVESTVALTVSSLCCLRCFVRYEETWRRICWRTLTGLWCFVHQGPCIAVRQKHTGALR